jgi:hypothetical protein
MWQSYVRGLHKSGDGVQQVRARAAQSQLELIGAHATICESLVSNYKGIHGIIIDHSKNTYSLAVPMLAKVSTSGSEGPSSSTYSTLLLPKDDVSLSIKIPVGASNNTKSGTKSNLLILHGNLKKIRPLDA